MLKATWHSSHHDWRTTRTTETLTLPIQCEPSLPPSSSSSDELDTGVIAVEEDDGEGKHDVTEFNPTLISPRWQGELVEHITRPWRRASRMRHSDDALAVCERIVLRHQPSTSRMDS